MPRYGATLDENTVPLGQGGTSGGWEGKPSHPAATTPAVAVGHGIPSSTEEGSLLSRDALRI